MTNSWHFCMNQHPHQVSNQTHLPISRFNSSSSGNSQYSRELNQRLYLYLQTFQRCGAALSFQFVDSKTQTALSFSCRPWRVTTIRELFQIGATMFFQLTQYLRKWEVSSSTSLMSPNSPRKYNIKVQKWTEMFGTGISSLWCHTGPWHHLVSHRRWSRKSRIQQSR